MNTDQSFQEPPAGAGRGAGSSDLDEEAGQDFVPPDDTESEAAAVSETPNALAGVDAQLLEAKRAVEEAMRQGLAQGTGAQSFESFQAGGNIQGVAIGLGDDPNAASAQAPGEPVLTVYVAEPTSVDQVRAVLVNSLGVQAASSDDLPIAVEVTGLIDAQAHRFRLRPAPGGISTGHFRITAGTIGCLARGRTAPRNARLMVLSNNHVIANSNSAAFGDCIVQPGPYDGGKCPQDQIAILERFVPINFSGGANFVDAATGWAWPDRVRRELVYLSGGSLHLFRISSAPVAPALGMLVGKTGRTTQLRQGRVTGIGVTIKVNYGGGRIALFQDQIAIRGTSGLFSQGGDSGSTVWTWNAQRNPVGLLFAGGGDLTFANRMARVVTALDINVVT